MVKSNKNQYYLLFDINTKDPNFYSNFYSDIKEFLIFFLVSQNGCKYISKRNVYEFYKIN